MPDMTIASAVTQIISLLSLLVAGVIWYVIQQAITDVKKAAAAMEGRLVARINDTRADLKQEISGIEKDGLEMKAAMYKSLDSLSDKYVPRGEITEIVRSIRERQDTAVETLKSVDTNVRSMEVSLRGLLVEMIRSIKGE